MTSNTRPLKENLLAFEVRGNETDQLRAQLEEQTKALRTLLREHGELNSRYRHLKKELERAGRVQQSLLPRCFRALDGYGFDALYRPCEAVGGDFYDVVHASDVAFILVSDVVGHGLEAALMTTLIKSVFHDAAHPESPPELLLNEMNGRLHRVLPSELFAVAAIVRLAAGVSQIQIANAGLPYPFVLRSGQKRVDELEMPGFPLSLFEKAQYEGHSVVVAPGDVLLLGTDGIRSISNSQGDHFEGASMSRVLRDLVACDGATVIERLMASALAFGNGKPLPDDVNLVAVTRRES